MDVILDMLIWDVKMEGSEVGVTMEHALECDFFN